MRTALLLASLLVSVPALAHEGGAHARGTVKEIGPERLVVTTTSGADATFTLGPTTQFVRGHRTIQAGEVRAGERVVVHAATRDGKLQATEVMVPEPAK